MHLKAKKQFFIPIACATLSACLLTACSSQKPEAVSEITALTDVEEQVIKQKDNLGSQYSLENMPEPQAEKPTSCADVLLLSARGTNEPQGAKNLLAPVLKNLAAKLNASTQTIDIDYAANTDFGQSIPEAIRKIIDTLTVHQQTCPEQKFILAGYSQGAMAIGEALTTSDLRLLGADTGQISKNTADNIAGIVFYGDPRFLASDSFNAGTFKNDIDGALPRLPGALDNFSKTIRSYCVAKDIVCQAKQEINETGHIEYFNNGMQTAGTDFLYELLVTQNPDFAETTNTTDNDPNSDAEND